MICHQISLRSFRNVRSATVSFCDGINLVLGDNAQGKTNLLEAVALMALGKSFRGAHDGELITFGEANCGVEMVYSDGVRQQTAAVEIGANHRKIWSQNGIRVPKVAEMVGRFRVVIFQPEHLSIIKSGPELRRSFMDVALCQSRPVYMNALQRYQGILKERNRLLKEAKEERMSMDTVLPMLNVYTEQLTVAANVITRYRSHFVREVAMDVINTFWEMVGSAEQPSFTYHGTLGENGENERGDTEERIYQQLRSNYAREIAAGVTLYGPHRDDIEIMINGKSARLFASQGQQRSLSLAMKLAEGEISRATHGDYPVFLFDDVLSELDGKRREFLLSRLSGRQVILSGCEKIDASQYGARTAAVSVKGGVFTPLSPDDANAPS